jgi:hypothetical protein
MERGSSRNKEGRKIAIAQAEKLKNPRDKSLGMSSSPVDERMSKSHRLKLYLGSINSTRCQEIIDLKLNSTLPVTMSLLTRHKKRKNKKQKSCNPPKSARQTSERR